VRLVDREAGEHQSINGGHHAHDEAAEQRWRLVLSEPSAPVRMTVRRRPTPPVSPVAATGRVAVEPGRRGRAGARKGPWVGVLVLASAAAWFA
jgi:hypothetical protein